MKQQDSPLSLGTDSLSTLLMRYALPSIIAMVSSSLYNMIDSIFIGHGVGPLAISGLALTMPLMNLAAAFGAMVGVGSAALTSIRLGQGNKLAAEHILGNVLLLNVTMGLMFTFLGLYFLDDLLYLFGASESTVGYARDFMRVILAGNIVTHIYFGLNHQLRVSGYPRKSMMIMLISVGVNVVLAWLFIFVFGWGIKGSALATVLAQTVSLCIQIAHFSDPSHFIHFKSGIFRFRWDIVRNIIGIGMAPFFIQSCACVVVILINNAMRDHGGDLSIGAYGIVNRVAFIFVMVVMGLNQGMQPIVGYNYGAGKYDRVIKVLWMTVGWATLIMSAGFAVSELFPYAVVRLFVSEDGGGDAVALIDMAAHGLKIIMMMFPVVGFQIVAGNFFQFIGKAKRAILMSVTRQMLFIVPLLLVLPERWGTDGVWYSMPIADGVSVLLAAVLLVLQLRKFRREMKTR
ncbi:MATE family efflux transporter [Alistipes sp. Z76]|nr:MATE family efflux transporter [Alistipes sp. Z76]NCE70578.1 MATE family efflux transporter [Muribaculaceae bacterium M3]